jgi:type II secretion system protein G
MFHLLELFTPPFVTRGIMFSPTFSHKIRSIRRGFTLIEVLVVVVILGILAAIMVPQVSSARNDARTGRREQDLRAVEKSLEMYANDFGVYPYRWGWGSESPTWGGMAMSGNTGYVPALAPTYILELPRDPALTGPTANRGYLYLSNGTDYKFMAHNVLGGVPANHPLLDPPRPTTSLSVWTAGGRNW